ncbi:MAG: hypothetical protein ACRDT6_07435 [Micromonosporaceae bacterium]
MPDQLEEALSRTFSAAAEAAPERPPGLAHAVDVRFRGRRRRRYAAVAGVAAFAVIGGSALATGVITIPRPGPSTVGIPAASGGATAPIASVWPDAVRQVSGKLADGRKYRPEVMLDDHRLLVTTEASFENANELWVMDLDTLRATRITRLPEPHEGRELFASSFTVGAGHVAWWDAYVGGGKPYTRIWKVPVSGGEPSLVGTVPGMYGSGGQSGDRLQIGSDRNVYWSAGLGNRSVKPAVWKLPLTGGEPRKVAGSDGYHLVNWPWIGSPAIDHSGDGFVVDGPDDPGFVAYQRLRNIMTDEVRDAVPAAKGELWSCAVVWCVNGRDDYTLARHRDGSHQRTLPGMSSVPTEWIAYDRFVVLDDFANRGSQSIHDLQTGKHGDFGIKPVDDGAGGWTADSVGVLTLDARFIHWSLDGGKTIWILDLGAIK